MCLTVSILHKMLHLCGPLNRKKQILISFDSKTHSHNCIQLQLTLTHAIAQLNLLADSGVSSRGVAIVEPYLLKHL